MSFVDVSPSTDMQLNDSSHASRSNLRKSRGLAATSVNRYTSMVASLWMNHARTLGDAEKRDLF